MPAVMVTKKRDILVPGFQDPLLTGPYHLQILIDPVTTDLVTTTNNVHTTGITIIRTAEAISNVPPTTAIITQVGIIAITTGQIPTVRTTETITTTDVPIIRMAKEANSNHTTGTTTETEIHINLVHNTIEMEMISSAVPTERVVTRTNVIRMAAMEVIVAPPLTVRTTTTAEVGMAHDQVVTTTHARVASRMAKCTNNLLLILTNPSA
jgi:hypothetical protein